MEIVCRPFGGHRYFFQNMRGAETERIIPQSSVFSNIEVRRCDEGRDCRNGDLQGLASWWNATPLQVADSRLFENNY
jgi:hypothetical protein